MSVPIAASSRQAAVRLGCVAVAVAGHLIAFSVLERGASKAPSGSGVLGSGAPRAIGVRWLAASDLRLARALSSHSSTLPKLTSEADPEAGSNRADTPLPSSKRQQVRPPPSWARRAALNRPSDSLANHLPKADPASAANPAIEAPVAPAHFYTFDEVEVPAAPVSDWQLDAATLDSARIPRLVFELYVGDDGAVIACNIVEPPTLDDALRDMLEARLRSTVLLPAVRTGRPVDSVRRIELTVS